MASLLLAAAAGVVLYDRHLPGHLWLAGGYLGAGVLLMLWALTAPPAATELVPQRLVPPGVPARTQQTT